MFLLEKLTNHLQVGDQLPVILLQCHNKSQITGFHWHQWQNCISCSILVSEPSVYLWDYIGSFPLDFGSVDSYTLPRKEEGEVRPSSELATLMLCPCHKRISFASRPPGIPPEYVMSIPMNNRHPSKLLWVLPRALTLAVNMSEDEQGYRMICSQHSAQQLLATRNVHCYIANNESD